MLSFTLKNYDTHIYREDIELTRNIKKKLQLLGITMVKT